MTKEERAAIDQANKLIRELETHGYVECEGQGPDGEPITVRLTELGFKAGILLAGLMNPLKLIQMGKDRMKVDALFDLAESLGIPPENVISVDRKS